MKIQWAWRASVLAVLALVVLQTESRGQVYYGQPYGATPQAVYGPSGMAFVYAPAPGGSASPNLVPAAYYNGGPQAAEAAPHSDSSADCDGACDAGGDEYLFGSGPPGRHHGACLASVLSWLAPYSETGCCAPHWFDVHAEAVFLRRNDNAAFQEFVRLTRQGDALITSDSLSLDSLDASLRITGVYQTGPGSNLEFTYFGLNESENKASVSSADDLLFSAFNDFGNRLKIEQLHQAEFQSMEMATDFDSLELNYRRRWMGPTCLVQGSWLIGVRYFELEDQLRFYSRAHRFEYDAVKDELDEIGGEAWYNLKTRNYMTGAQLGGDVWLCLLPGLRVGLDGKAGIYGNNVKVDTFMAGTDPWDPDADNYYKVFIPPERLGNDKVSFIGELQLLLTYQLSHNFTLRASYEMMWVEGVAMAMENFNPTITYVMTTRIPIMSDGGSLFYDGFAIGAEWMW